MICYCFLKEEELKVQEIKVGLYDRWVQLLQELLQEEEQEQAWSWGDDHEGDDKEEVTKNEWSEQKQNEEAHRWHDDHIDELSSSRRLERIALEDVLSFTVLCEGPEG